MAIGALANATLQLRVRDDWIGWTPAAVLKRLRDNPQDWSRMRTTLTEAIKDARSEIRQDDLRSHTGRQRDEKLEQSLLALASSASAKRQADSRSRSSKVEAGEQVDSLRLLPLLKSGKIDWKTASERPLFVAKRARTLAALLFAERILQSLPRNAPQAIDLVASNSDAYKALSIALREIRKRGLASRVLELNVCGAVPPYRDLLLGKLAALAAASAELHKAYRSRYADRPSEIASQMAGRPIVRDTDVCVVGTTSLYGIAASQYNRLRIDAPTSRGPHQIHWIDLGLTEGYGTTHFSDDTVHSLRTLSIKHRGGRRVNNVFGEGQSPRLRQVREGLEDLGLESDQLLNHRSPRRVYALEVYPDSKQDLLFTRRGRCPLPSFAEVAKGWSARWLANRIHYKEALQRVSQQGPQSVQDELTPPPSEEFLFQPVAQSRSESPASTLGSTPMHRKSEPGLIHDLYRASAACADHHTDDAVERMHIPTAVETFVADTAAPGTVIFVTGNPGDGKTHLLKRLSPHLKAKKVDVQFDANEQDDESLTSAIENAIGKRSRGLALAINEGVLVSLASQHADRPWAKVVLQQIMSPFEYRDVVAGSASPVLVVDLNLRNTLAEEVVTKCLGVQRKMACACCPECPLEVNAARLVGQAEGRLVRLLEHVARTGFHATMRDLQAFVAFVLGGNVCGAPDANKAAANYWDNAFVGGQGPLFDAVRRFDPLARAVPLLDDVIWRKGESAKGWFGASSDRLNGSDDLQAKRAAFASIKRRAMFEHADGENILAVSGSPIDRMMQSVLKPSGASLRQLIRLLNRSFDRDETTTDLLHLWACHRYDAQASRFAAALLSVPTGDLELLAPRLPARVSKAFPDFVPSHAVLCFRGQPPTEGLRVDRELVDALVTAEHGMPATFRRGEPEVRIAAFYGRLAKRYAGVQEDLRTVKLVDIDTGRNATVSIDIVQRRFTRS
jgi:hypothetical protein